MTEDKEESKFTQFINNIEDKISNLTTLEIKTVVGDYGVEKNLDIYPKEDAQFLIMHSQVDLVDGDITTKISRSVMQQEFAWMRDFHAEKERRSHEIVQDNIKAIKSLYELFHNTKSMKKDAGDSI